MNDAARSLCRVRETLVPAYAIAQAAGVSCAAVESLFRRENIRPDAGIPGMALLYRASRIQELANFVLQNPR